MRFTVFLQNNAELDADDHGFDCFLEHCDEFDLIPYDDNRPSEHDECDDDDIEEPMFDISS